MDCPKCRKGKIRVVTGFACSCGHHPLVCDGCSQQFTVSHSAPTEALPPEAEIYEDDSHRKSYGEMIAFLKDKNAPTYEQATRAAIQAQPELFPLLEDFKASQTS